ncbi:MAG: glycosyltransferase family 4 protein [Negativicutes bacterium]|jgi:glycosyltransferase involved in cell wall biosynthesis
MRIVIICHYFWPEIGAPSARLLAFARRWVDMGHDVQVVTCFPNHPTGEIPTEYRGKLYLKERFEGITIHRTYVFATPNQGFFKKILGHISFMASSFISINKLGKVDVVVASSPTFFSILSGLLISKFKKAKFVLEIRDLWPDAIVALGVLKNKLAINVLEKIEHFFYRSCDKLVVVSNAFKNIIVNSNIGITPEKITVITNGYDANVFSAGFEKNYDREISFAERFIVTYLGAFGMSQNLMTIMEVALKLKDENIQFVLVGEGTDKKKLQEYVKINALSNVTFVSEQPKEKVVECYRESDICLVPLKKVELFNSFIPSKIFEIMGCGVPIVASLEGESAEIIIESCSGVTVEPDNVNEISGAILKLMKAPELRKSMSENGKIFAKTKYDRAKLAERYFDEVLSI